MDKVFRGLQKHFSRKAVSPHWGVWQSQRHPLVCSFSWCLKMSSGSSLTTLRSVSLIGASITPRTCVDSSFWQSRLANQAVLWQKWPADIILFLSRRARLWGQRRVSASSLTDHEQISQRSLETHTCFCTKNIKEQYLSPSVTYETPLTFLIRRTMWLRSGIIEPQVNRQLWP